MLEQTSELLYPGKSGLGLMAGSHRMVVSKDAVARSCGWLGLGVPGPRGAHLTV